MFCTQCGVELNPTANFCRRCGAKVRKNTNPTFTANVSTMQMLQKARDKIKDFSEPKIEYTRTVVTKKIDDLTTTVKDPKKLTSLSSKQRDYLAQRLASIRTKLAKKQQETGKSDYEPTVEEAYEILELNEELLIQLENDKCFICYKNLKLEKSEDKQEELVICPQCGHGGHKNHILSWFETNKSCPYCKASITKEQVLILKY